MTTDRAGQAGTQLGAGGMSGVEVTRVNAPAPEATRAQLPEPLTAADRCDRCGAQAYVRAVFPEGTDLLFCAHHGREAAPLLAARGIEVQDGSERLAEDARG